VILVGISVLLSYLSIAGLSDILFPKNKAMKGRSDTHETAEIF
jgi:hypothetical protein